MAHRLAALEELLLLAICALEDTAYGVSIHHKLAEAGAPTSLGAIYAALERLEQRALVQSTLGDATATRGGRRKRLFRVTGAGRAALRRHDAVRASLQPTRGELAR